MSERYKQNPGLGVWVKNQREEYKKYQKEGKSYMTEERIAKLEIVGFAWSIAAKQAPPFKLGRQIREFLGARTR